MLPRRFSPWIFLPFAFIIFFIIFLGNNGYENTTSVFTVITQYQQMDVNDLLSMTVDDNNVNHDDDDDDEEEDGDDDDGDENADEDGRKNPTCHRSMRKQANFNDLVEKFYKSEWKPVHCKYYSSIYVEDVDGVLYFRGGDYSISYLCKAIPIYRETEDQQKQGKAVKIESFPYSDWPNDTDLLAILCRKNNENSSVHPSFAGVFTHIAKPDIQVAPFLPLRKSKPTDDEKWNVLILTIDSLSRMNAFHRLPESITKLKELHAIDQKWNNKIGLNTYPNTMALLTGLDYNKVGFNYNKSFDDFPFIWKGFKQANYKTFFAEDSAPDYTTFNYQRKGFIQQPVDHYGRILFKVAHGITEESIKNKGICLMGQFSHSILWKYMKQFVEAYHGVLPIFGMSFVNEITHDYFANVAQLDQELAELLNWLEAKQVFDDTFVIIWSDHGQRIDDVRKSDVLGRLEDQTPFSSIIVPTKFRRLHPTLVNNLEHNSNRLSTSYDLHHTLRHILCISLGQQCPEYSTENCLDGNPCSTSLLSTKLRYDRTCYAARIPDGYCSCYKIDFIRNHKNSESLTKQAEVIGNKMVDTVNGILTSSTFQVTNGSKCAQLQFTKLLNGQAIENDNGTVTALIVQLQASPEDVIFEAHVRLPVLETKKLDVVGGINRIDKYFSTSRCVSDANIRPLCVCINN